MQNGFVNEIPQRFILHPNLISLLQTWTVQYNYDTSWVANTTLALNRGWRERKNIIWMTNKFDVLQKRSVIHDVIKTYEGRDGEPLRWSWKIDVLAWCWWGMDWWDGMDGWKPGRFANKSNALIVRRKCILMKNPYQYVWYWLI